MSYLFSICYNVFFSITTCLSGLLVVGMAYGFHQYRGMPFGWVIFVAALVFVAVAFGLYCAVSNIRNNVP